MIRILIASAMLLFTPWSSQPVQFRCDATQKIDPDGLWDAERLRQGQWHIMLDDFGEGASISRCSFAPSQGRITCDEYVVDRIEVDPNIGAKKYYVFASQYDLQVFAGLTFVENNGRESVMFGQCRVTAP